LAIISKLTFSLVFALTLLLASPTTSAPFQTSSLIQQAFAVEEITLDKTERLQNSILESYSDGSFIAKLGQPEYVFDGSKWSDSITVFDGTDIRVNTARGNIIFESNTCKQTFLPVFNPLTKTNQVFDEDGNEISFDYLDHTILVDVDGNPIISEGYQKLWTVEKLQGGSFVEQELEQMVCTLELISNSTGNYVKQTQTGLEGSFIEVITAFVIDSK